jgi:TM2 domain-containing membrane protein YozV
MSTPAAWYVKTKSGSAGPFTMEQLKATANAGKLPESAMLSQRPDGPWIPAGDFRQLFPEEEFNAEDLRPGDLVPDSVKKMSMTVYSAIGKAAVGTTGMVTGAVESIKENQRLKSLEREEAKNARIRTLERNREEYFSQPDPPPPRFPNNVRIIERHIHHAPQPMNVQQVVHVNNNTTRRDKGWSRGVAMLLSLIIPGLGQLYKGQVISAVFWFFAVAIGYVAFIIPGAFLHFCCVLGAGMGDEFR